MCSKYQTGKVMRQLLTSLLTYLGRYKKTFQSSLSIYKAQLYLIDRIDPSKFYSVYSSKYSIVQLTTLYDDIHKYNTFLKEFLDKTPQDIYIPTYNINRAITSVSLKNWFIVNGSYIDTVSYISSFLSNAKDFIELYEHWSEQEDVPFNTRKNINNAKPVLNNLFTLLEELYHVN